MRRIVNLSLAPPDNDARVMRTLSLATAIGCEPVLVAPGHGFTRPVMSRAEKLRLTLAYGGVGRLPLADAHRAFFSVPYHRMALDAVTEAHPELIHAHDWDALPIAAVAAAQLGIPFIYDAHEFATDMHRDRRAWRMIFPNLIDALQRRYSPQAAAVVAVSDGIGRALMARYGLTAQPVTVRNIPDLSRIAPHVSNPESLLIHYHGVLAEGRAIEHAVAALPLLPASLPDATHRTLAAAEVPERARTSYGGKRNRRTSRGAPGGRA